MAATNFTPISLYYSTTASAVPSAGNLVAGELALNTADMKLYAKNSAGTVTLLASSSSTGATVSSVSGTGTVNGLTLTGTVTTSGSLTLGGTLSLVSPPPIGSTTPNTGAFTTLSSTLGANFATSSGSVGIGTGSPTGGSKLDVNGLIVAQNGTTSSLGFAFRSALSSGMYLYDDGIGGNVVLQANANNNQLYLQRTGNIGVGTTNAVGKLSIDAPNTLVAPTLSMRNAGGTYGFDFDSETVSTGRLDLYRVNIGVRSLTMSWLRGSGHIGIGTDAPSYTVDIKTDANNALRVGSSANAFGTLLQWNNASGFGRLTTIGGYPLDLGTNENTRFRIGDAGQFGIGGATYGNAGEVLTSGGASAAPTWAAAGGGSQAFVAFGSTGGL